MGILVQGFLRWFGAGRGQEARRQEGCSRRVLMDQFQNGIFLI